MTTTETVNTIIHHAEQQCKTHGSRLTNKRKHVLSSLLNSGKALSAYELIARCQQEYDAKLAAMSMYRILSFLQQMGLVHKLHLANKYVACAHIRCDHAHDVPQFLICAQCQKVEEISIDQHTLSALHHNVADAGFHLLSPQIEMNCVCEHCRIDVA